MANTYRYYSGDAKIKKVAVDSATVIEIGDAVWLDTDDAKPASDLTYLSSLALTQESFHDNFLGIALDQSRSGDTDPIRVSSGGVWRMACASATFEVGDLVGMDDNALATALLNQQVIASSTAARSIGRVHRRQASAVTELLVEIVGTISHGGPQVAA